MPETPSYTPRFEELLFDVHDGTATITLDRPRVMNACTPTLYREIRDAVRLSNLRDDIDVIVIQGAGDAFCTGGDLTAFLEALRSKDPLAVFEFADNVPFEALRSSRKVTIAKIDGACLAGGMMIALSCDLTIASRRSLFGVPEGRVGMAEAWLPNLLFGRVSLAHAKLLMLTGDSIGADEAERIGLIAQVVDDADLDTAADELVRRVRTTSPYARTLYKQYADRLIQRASADDSHHVIRSGDALRGLENFAVKGGGTPSFPVGTRI